jgi:pimeloyl-ACP methyl ester carboxylesterase
MPFARESPEKGRPPMDATVRYAKTRDGVSIAYLDVGAGSPLVYLPPGGNAGQALQQSAVRTWLERLSGRWRIVRPDYRGIGLSDRGWNSTLT